MLLKTYRDKAFANIDVLLKKQADLIPQLITIAEQVMAHEKSLFLQLSDRPSDTLVPFYKRRLFILFWKKHLAILALTSSPVAANTVSSTSSGAL
ncbi:LemA family protein [Photorhabdus asymbiotica]|uniref:LemA family protein n=1 Tax=Photorhabdus asymbiotica TaxID=291112 RepID=UPI003DA6D93B